MSLTEKSVAYLNEQLHSLHFTQRYNNATVSHLLFNDMIACSFTLKDFQDVNSNQSILGVCIDLFHKLIDNDATKLMHSSDGINSYHQVNKKSLISYASS
jgi:capsid portal protein